MSNETQGNRTVMILISLVALLFLVLLVGGGFIVYRVVFAPDAAEPTPAVALSLTQEVVIIVATPTETSTSEDATTDESAAAPTATTAANTTATETPIPLDPVPVEEGDPIVTANLNLNVRTGPSTQYDVVGALLGGESAKVIGKAADVLWWQIECPAGVTGQCWVSGGDQFSIATNVDNVPVVAAPATPTATYTLTPLPTATATITSTATLTSTSTITATGTITGTATATIDPNASPTATSTTDPNATETPTPTPTDSNTFTPAPADGDSLQSPAQFVEFRPTGPTQFVHTNQVSYSEGDTEDWIGYAFPESTNASETVDLILTCTTTGPGSAQLVATIWENGFEAPSKTIECNTAQVFSIDPSMTQLIRIYFRNATENGSRGEYTLTVTGYPAYP